MFLLRFGIQNITKRNTPQSIARIVISTYLLCTFVSVLHCQQILSSIFSLIYVVNEEIMLKGICIIRQAPFPEDTRLRKEAETLRDKGWNVTVISAKYKKQSFRENWNKIKIYRLPVPHTRRSMTKMLLEYLAFSALAFVLQTALFLFKRFSVIQVNAMPDFLIFTTIIPRLFKIPIILDMYELMPELYRSLNNVGP